MDLLDRVITEFDRGLRTVAGVATAARRSPADGLAEAALSADQKAEAAALMRVNHCGEVCAQALYQGQALASKDDGLKRALHVAAAEEEDHLAWTAARIKELGGRTSLLNPLWYLGSLAIGFAAGRAGDRWNLGFLRETERQVEAHLEGHLTRLAPEDERTRAVVAAMKADERAHADMAASLGAADLPAPVAAAMRAVAKVMTTASHRI